MIKPSVRRYYGLETDCRAGKDGDCTWKQCPQLSDGEPRKTGRHCPLDVYEKEPHDERAKEKVRPNLYGRGARVLPVKSGKGSKSR